AKNDELGGAVSLSGDTVAIGLPSKFFNGSPGYGAVCVFVRSGASWSEQALLTAFNAGINDTFGSALALAADTLVVGAREEDGPASGVDGDPFENGSGGSGAAYVLTRSGTTWKQVSYLKPGFNFLEQEFGHAVAAEPDMVVVGGNDSSTAAGVNGD